MIKALKLICLASIVSCSIYTNVHAQPYVQNSVKNPDNLDVTQLEKRIAELEAIVSDLKPQNQNNEVEPSNTSELSENAEMAIYSYEDLSNSFNNSLKVSGYADVEYKGYEDPNKNEEFRMHHLSLFFTKQFDNNIKFFSEIEYEDAPKFEGVNDGSGDLEVASGKIFVEALNFDWHYSQYVNMRVGRFFTPAGIWSEDHYPPFVTTQERPLHIRKIFPQLVDGMSFFGSLELFNNHLINYTTYLGNGESDNNLSGKTDTNSSKALGFKADYNAPWLDDFLLGFTVYQDNNDSSINANESLNAKKLAWGSHLKIRYNNITLQAEYAKTDKTFDNTINNYQSDGYYTQVSYDLNRWLFGYRYDVLDTNTELNNKKQRNSLFVNFHVNHNINLKVEYHDDSYADPTTIGYGFYIFSITGYLGS